MDIAGTFRTAQHLVKHNSPAILTGVSVAGTVTTALLAARGGMQSAQAITKEELRLGHPITGPAKLTLKEKLALCWPFFVPAVGVGSLTIACTIGANHVSGRRAAALAGAYSLTDRAFSEYRDKVAEQLGAGKEQKVRDAIAQDQVDKNPPTHNEIHITDSADIVCYEVMSGRYFTTSVEALKKARNTLNKKLLDEMYASLNDYWDLIGLTGTTMGDQLGWTSDNLLEIHISTTLSPDGKPCLSLGYVNAPKVDYYKFR